MIFALIGMDLVWALGLIAVSMPAAWSALRVFTAMTSPDPMHTAFALVLAFVTFVTVFTADVCAVLVLLPKPRAGRYAMLRGRDFYFWSLGFIARRWLDIPPVSVLVRQSSLARLVFLTAAGARVHPVSNMSSDVAVLDPYMLEVGRDTVIGSGVVVTGHMVFDGALVLAPVVIASGAEVGADARIAPGVSVGERAQVQAGAVLCPFVHVGDQAVISIRAVVGARVRVGRGARIAANVYVPADTVIPDGGAYPPTDASVSA